MKWYVEERFRTHLRRRFKLHSRAQVYHHLPTAALYGRYGLLKIPTTAGYRGGGPRRRPLLSWLQLLRVLFQYRLIPTEF